MVAQLNKKGQLYYVGDGTGDVTTEISTERNPVSNLNYIKKVKQLPTESNKQ
jgi:hypothetical protein